MTPSQLRRIRVKISLTQGTFARALGYKDADAYRKYESGTRPVPVLLAATAEMIDLHGMPNDWVNRERESESRPIPLLLSRLVEMINLYGAPSDWTDRGEA